MPLPREAGHGSGVTLTGDRQPATATRNRRPATGSHDGLLVA